jgi:hypothetical protein
VRCADRSRQLEFADRDDYGCHFAGDSVFVYVRIHERAAGCHLEFVEHFAMVLRLCDRDGEHAVDAEPESSQYSADADNGHSLADRRFSEFRV